MFCFSQLIPTLFLSQWILNFSFKRNTLPSFSFSINSSAWSGSKCPPPRKSSKEGCVHCSCNTKLIHYVSSEMNTLKAFGTPSPYRFLSVLFCACTFPSAIYCWTKQMWTKRRISALSPLTSLRFHTLPVCSFLSLLLCLAHLFTRLLEEGHNEINVYFSREKTVCFYLSHIFFIRLSYF